MPEVHRNDLLEEAKFHFNEPLLNCHIVCRLIGYAEDEIDCYWILKAMGGEISYCTCVGGYTWLTCLKGQAKVGDWDDFTRLDDMLGFNGCPKAEEFIIEIGHSRGC